MQLWWHLALKMISLHFKPTQTMSNSQLRFQQQSKRSCFLISQLWQSRLQLLEMRVVKHFVIENELKKSKKWRKFMICEVYVSCFFFFVPMRFDYCNIVWKYSCGVLNKPCWFGSHNDFQWTMYRLLKLLSLSKRYEL